MVGFFAGVRDCRELRCGRECSIYECGCESVSLVFGQGEKRVDADRFAVGEGLNSGDDFVGLSYVVEAVARVV